MNQKQQVFLLCVQTAAMVLAIQRGRSHGFAAACVGYAATINPAGYPPDIPLADAAFNYVELQATVTMPGKSHPVWPAWMEDTQQEVSN
jgi:hypothetical protein